MMNRVSLSSKSQDGAPVFAKRGFLRFRTSGGMIEERNEHVFYREPLKLLLERACALSESSMLVRHRAGEVTLNWRLVLALFRFLPSFPLSASIEAFCFYEGDTSQAPRKERCLPNGQVAMVINLGHDTLRVAHLPYADQFQCFHGGVLTGAFSQFSVIDTTTMVTTLSICFKPGGARLFLPMPAASLTNQVVDLSCIFGTAACDLREQLQVASTNDERVRILERFLRERACWEQALHPAVRFALTSFQNGNERRSISEVTIQLGMSHKRFISLFEEAVGLTPKAFCRVQRFQEVLRLIENGQQISWADFALDCGYFDQAHFIHDFQAFSGLTPQAYLAQCSPYRNHVPLPE
ncbi:MAG: helix-turn-helix domain-containing protein [Ktedonobacteraceae bacterium]|nr:helix-turn-helix domain-containing protein [Ktedonobacteraceae bacterium]